MPWNDQSGGPPSGGKGPWGGGPRQPWGTPPRAPQEPPEDIEQILRRWRERFRMGGGNGGGVAAGGGRRGLPAPIIAGILFVGWLLTGVYIVDEGENAVISRLGAYSRVSGPGMSMHLPVPFESHQIVNVTGQRVESIGVVAQGQNTVDYPEESLMITGDRNIVAIHFSIYFNIKDVRAFVYNVRDPVRTGPDPGAVRQVAESAMREEIGRRELSLIITRDRGAVEEAVARIAQQVLDEYQTGVQVLRVQIESATWPGEVSAAFNDVISANQEAEQAINNARRDTARITAAAQAYREQTIREATGEAQAFMSVYNEYRLAPRVTRDRIYTETMERVFAGANLVVLDSRGGAVTYLPLDSLIRRNQPQTTPPQAQGTR